MLESFDPLRWTANVASLLTKQGTFQCVLSKIDGCKMDGASQAALRLQQLEASQGIAVKNVTIRRGATSFGGEVERLYWRLAGSSSMSSGPAALTRLGRSKKKRIRSCANN